MQLKAVIFDFDGTLTEAGSINFQEIRKRIGCPETQFILDYIDNLKGNEKITAAKILDECENIAAGESVESPYAQEVIHLLNDYNIPVIIISRNSRSSVLRALENFKSIRETDFYKIISRDDPYKVKPDPESLLTIMNELGLSKDDICIIGDFIHDIEAGRRAGIKTIYKRTGRPEDETVPSDHFISSLEELPPLFEKWLPLKKGKTPYS
jgi:HAD superfamily hydrolase (TIGR01549 family)